MSDIRISGLESKIDIESTITALVAARGYRINNYEDEMSEVSYDMEAWNDILALAVDLTDSLDTLRSWETWNEMAATSTDEDIVTATASSSAVPTTYSIVVNNLAQAQNVASEKVSDLVSGGGADTDLVAAGVISAGSSFSIEGQTITIDSSETLNTLVGKINTAAESMGSGNKVLASILDDRLVILREDTGSAEINATDIGGTPLENLGVLNSSGGFANELVAAADASFTVNGALVTRSDNTGLDDVITGVTLNLYNETDTIPVRLTIAYDTEDAKASLQDFVEKYNAMAEQIRYFTQIPLSGDSASGATVEALGELYNDSLAKEIERKMRQYATASEYPYLNATNAEYSYDGKTGVCNCLDDMGIWTQGESNALEITDEDKLDYMLENEFELCGQLFRGVYDDDEGYVHGIASDFYKYASNVSESITGEIASRTSSLDDKLSELEDKIEEEEASLENYEEMLIEQFTAMEEAEAQLNAELDWFEQQDFG